MIRLSTVREALSAHHPLLLSEDPGKQRAAVAAILAGPEERPHLLFIERAEHPEDPWSGHIAFPGGRVEASDPDLRSAAERETWEEIGLDLEEAEFLGRLDDLTGATLPVQVSAFAYCVEQPVCLAPGPEVKAVFWVEVARLLDPARHRMEIFPFRGLEGRLLPAVDLLGPERPLLWGITYRFTARLLEIAGFPMPEAGAG